MHRLEAREQRITQLEAELMAMKKLLADSRSAETKCLKRPGQVSEACEASYIAGCDGAHSTVRETLKIGFSGGMY